MNGQSRRLKEFFYTVTMYFVEYAKLFNPNDIRTNSPAFGHAADILSAIKVREDLSARLQERYALLSEEERDPARLVPQYLTKMRADAYPENSNDDIIQLVTEAMEIASKRYKNVVPISHRYPDRDHTEPILPEKDKRYGKDGHYYPYDHLES